jgi:hypothetical protein
MSTEDGKLQDREVVARLAGSSALSPDPEAHPISRTWIIVGCAALLLGLVMGLIMSSFGK